MPDHYEKTVPAFPPGEVERVWMDALGRVPDREELLTRKQRSPSEVLRAFVDVAIDYPVYATARDIARALDIPDYRVFYLVRRAVNRARESRFTSGTQDAKVPERKPKTGEKP